MDDIVKIELFGQVFRFQPDKDVKDSQKVADALKFYVKQAEEQFETGAHCSDKLAVLLLAAMNLSKDFHELKLEHARLEDFVSTRASSLLNKINNNI